MQENNVIHRDLKPDNVFLDENGRLVIGDFGLGHLFELFQDHGAGKKTRNDFRDRTIGYCGTPGYMAPEIIRDDHYSYKVDNFSVGVMFYELVFGRVSILLTSSFFFADFDVIAPLPRQGSQRPRSKVTLRQCLHPSLVPQAVPCSIRPNASVTREKRRPQDLDEGCDEEPVLPRSVSNSIFVLLTFSDSGHRNWDQVAAKTQPVPATWRTSPLQVPHGAYLSKRVLIEDPYALQRWRPDPAEYEFLAPLRYRPGKEFPLYLTPILMPPPAISPDLREDRLAVGLMVKRIVERGIQPQDFVTVPLNEPIPSPQVQESSDIEMISVERYEAAFPRPYDFPRPITADPHREESGGHSLFSADGQLLISTKDFRSTQQALQAQDDDSDPFNVSIVAVEEYSPANAKPSSSRQQNLFPSSIANQEPQGRPRTTFISIPSGTYTTLAYPDSLEPVTPYQAPSNANPAKPLDFPTLCKALEARDITQQDIARVPEPKQLPTPPTFLAPQGFARATRPLATSNDLINFCGVSMDLSD